MKLAQRGWQRLNEVDARLLDGALAVGLAVAAGAQLLSQEPGNLARLLPVMGTCLPLVVRRRWPLVGNFLQVACAIATQREPVTFSLLAIFIGVYSVAVYSRWRGPFLTWIAVGAAMLGLAFPESAPSVPSWALMLVGGSALWLAGNAMHDRQLRAEVIEERAERLERERELSTRMALADERQRIARELHDVVAHSVSVMVVQAGAARTMLTVQPARSVEALLAVESTGREALGELRRLLGLLTEDQDHPEPSLSPQPGLEQLDRLVERVGQAGLAVELHVNGAQRRLPAGLDLTAYRIVQEALTNALKYASGAPTRVQIDFDTAEVRLEVVDGGGGESVPVASGAGRGILGMQERVAIYGGQLEAAKGANGGFIVRARLPLPPDAAC